MTRLDRTPAQQNAFSPAGDRADDDFWVVIKDIAAIGAHRPLAIIPFGNTANRRAAQLGVVRHCRSDRQRFARSARTPPQSAEPGGATKPHTGRLMMFELRIIGAASDCGKRASRLAMRLCEGV